MFKVSEPLSSWGGNWTQKKLDAFEKYVKAYLTIMDKHPFWETIYFDAFAGSGSRVSDEENILWKQLCILEEEQHLYKGAAERVVLLEKSFDWFYFIEKNKESREKLEFKLNELNPENSKKLVFRDEDCNTQILQMAKAMRTRKYAALLFLDPFGMQVNWETLLALKGTRTDIWILIPSGVIVNRLLDKQGKLKSIKKLEVFFGLSEEEIRKSFYNTVSVINLFGEQSELVNKIVDPINKIANLYISNLKKIWKHVTLKPLRLNNSKGVPIFHFVFASNNKNAVNIAQTIIDKI